MSHDICETPQVTRFAGPEGMGICYQINQPGTGQHIELLSIEAEQAARAILQDIALRLNKIRAARATGQK